MVDAPVAAAAPHEEPKGGGRLGGCCQRTNEQPKSPKKETSEGVSENMCFGLLGTISQANTHRILVERVQAPSLHTLP